MAGETDRHAEWEGLDAAALVVATHCDHGMMLAAHPVGADAMSAELRRSAAMVMLRVVMMTKVLPVPAAPSTKRFSQRGR